MAIKAYVGIMGSGKTYEVVSVVIYGALKRGRRVVSNIAGLDFEVMKASLIAEGVDESKIGELVCIPHEKVFEPTFWRTDFDAEKGIESFLQPGDLLALDEIWRFWNGLGLKSEDGKQKRPERVMNFVQMHRQMTHPESGVACDVAIITQDPADIHRSIRGVVEETYLMTKLTAIGSTSRYRVDCFQKTRVTRSPLMSYQRSYDPAKFGFYKSHSQRKEGEAEAREENIDGRGNVLKGALIRVVLPLMLLVGIGAVWAVMRVFTPSQKPPAAAESKPDQKSPATASAPVVVPEKKSMNSDAWRVVGWFQSGGSLGVALVGEGDRLRVVYDPPNVQLHGLMLSVQLPEKDFATTYGGPALSSGLLGSRR